MIKAVLLDFDGTIMNTPPVIIESWQYAARTLLGHELPLETVVASFGEPIAVTIDNLFEGKDPQLVLKTYLDYSLGLEKDAIKMFPGMKELVFKLKELGYMVAMVTTRVWKRMHYEVYDFHIFDEFDAVVSGEDCTKHKPDPEPCLIALDRLGIAADEAIMVGDTNMDLECAHNAGIKCGLVRWSLNASPEDFAAADFILETPEDLFAYVK